MLTGQNVLLLQQIARDCLHTFWNRHNNTWHGLWWTTWRHWCEQVSQSKQNGLGANHHPTEYCLVRASIEPPPCPVFRFETVGFIPLPDLLCCIFDKRKHQGACNAAFTHQRDYFDSTKFEKHNFFRYEWPHMMFSDSDILLCVWKSEQYFSHKEPLPSLDHQLVAA